MEKIISLPFPFALRLRGGQRAWPWPGPGRPRPGSRPDSCRAGTEDHGGIPAALLTAERRPELERSGSAPGSGTCGVHRDRYRGRSTQAVPGADRGLEVRSHAGLSPWPCDTADVQCWPDAVRAPGRRPAEIPIRYVHVPGGHAVQPGPGYSSSPGERICGRIHRVPAQRSDPVPGLCPAAVVSASPVACRGSGEADQRRHEWESTSRRLARRWRQPEGGAGRCHRRTSAARRRRPARRRCALVPSTADRPSSAPGFSALKDRRVELAHMQLCD